jgi:hypothetical protein
VDAPPTTAAPFRKSRLLLVVFLDMLYLTV